MPRLLLGMTPTQLIDAGTTLFGVHWRVPMAAKLEVDIATLRRWVSGTTPIPGPASLAISLLLSQHKSDI